LKLKLKKSITKGTLFEGNKHLKLVLPCLSGKNGHDYIIKEFMAYKIFEIISPYYFKTRLANIEFIRKRGQQTKKYDLQGILIEDIDNVAKRLNARKYKKFVHPFQQNARASIQNHFFQYLIGNTDFSTRWQHNEKLLFIDKRFVCIPFDFDMSGLVDANYAVVSGIQNMPIKISRVTQRLYKGYKRDELLLQEVRHDYINHKMQILETADNLKSLFNNPKNFLKARQFILGFFDILENDKKFNTYIVSRTRTK
jgi:hypothetical protein